MVSELGQVLLDTVIVQFLDSSPYLFVKILAPL
jgi:hypothetical protein